MRKIKRNKSALVFVAVFLCIAVVSCKRGDPDPTPSIPATSLSATIEGRAFYAEEITGTLTATNLLLRGIRNPGNSKQSILQISTTRFAGLGSYSIDSTTSAVYTEPAVSLNAISGSIEVTTSNDVHVKGTFSFLTQTGSAITNGKFDVYK